MKLLQFLQSRIVDVAAGILAAIFFVAGSVVSVLRFQQYEIFFYDFGIFDQAIWKVSRFMPPIIDHFVLGGRWIFADHFSPSIFLLSPLYWLTDRSEILLIAQVLIVTAAGLVIYAVGKRIVDDKFYSLAVLTSFYFFIGIQNAIISDFHEVTVSTLPFALVFYFFFKKRHIFYFLSLFILLGTKESTFLLGMGIGITLFLLQKNAWRISFLTIVLSLVWGFVSIKVVIPYFSEGIYQYAPSLPHDPSTLITSLFDDQQKTRTIFFSFLSFSFFPLLSPQFYLVIFQDFFIRFYPNWPTRWGLGLHYSAQLGVLMSLASIWTIRVLEIKKHHKRILPIISVVMVVNSVLLYAFILRGPLALVYNPAFLRHGQDFAFLDDMVSQVPKHASIMTHNNLAVRFTHQNVRLLRMNYEVYKPDFIMLDVRLGQGPNNFFGSGNPADILHSLQKDTNYQIVYQTQEQFIFQRRSFPLQ